MWCGENIAEPINASELSSKSQLTGKKFPKTEGYRGIDQSFPDSKLFSFWNRTKTVVTVFLYNTFEFLNSYVSRIVTGAELIL